jgi:AmmeMemoRadiSam system protein A
MIEKKLLLELARAAIKGAVLKGKVPKPDPASLPKEFSEPTACFVTLTKRGMLRGFIGHIFAQEPLYLAVMNNARGAAMRDYRFNPVEPSELGELELEISILTEPQPFEYSSPEELLTKLRPHQDGVVLKVGGRMATYLPQVWEHLPEPVAFLNSLAQKAGLPDGAWREAGAKILTYQVEAFSEGEG